MLVALSPEAEASPWVKLEYDRALSDAKPLIPLIYRECHIPDGLTSTQAESLVGLPYNQSILKTLDRLTRLLDPSLALPTDLGELYRRALATERGDPEQASRLLQRIVDRDSTYAGGEPARDLARINEKLLPTRIERLRSQAQEAHQSGEYGREAGALEALVALAPNDAWANEYLLIAQTNRRYLDLYAAIQHLIEIGDTAEARNKLTRLWQDSPYFRDPAGIAPKLGLRVPPTYEEVRAQRAQDARTANERKAAEERKSKAKAEAQDELTRATKTEIDQWDAVRRDVLRFSDAHGDTTSLPNSLAAGGTNRKEEVLSLEKSRHYRLQAIELSNRRTKVERRIATLREEPPFNSLSSRTYLVGVWLTLYIIYGFVIYSIEEKFFLSPSGVNTTSTTSSTVADLPGLIVPLVISVVFFVRSFSLARVTATFSRRFFRRVLGIGPRAELRRIEEQLQRVEAQADSWLDQWLKSADADHQRRLQQLQDMCRRRIADIEAHYQRELADIAQRYGSA